MGRTCTICKQWKPATEFHRHPSGKNGLQPGCKPCRSAKQKVEYNTKKQDENWYTSRLLKKRLREYGLTLAEFQAMQEHAGGKCAICGDEAPLVIDHDHETMEVRGLLCQLCNIMLGSGRDSIERLLAGAEYLRRFR